MMYICEDHAIITDLDFTLAWFTSFEIRLVPKFDLLTIQDNLSTKVITADEHAFCRTQSKLDRGNTSARMPQTNSNFRHKVCGEHAIPIRVRPTITPFKVFSH